MDEQVSIKHIPRVRTRVGVRVNMIAKQEHVLADLPLSVPRNHVWAIDVRRRHCRETGTP